MLLAIVGIAAEILGFWLIIKATRRLEFREGDFVSDRYVEPSTDRPPQHIEGPPNPRFYRPGIYLVIAGLAAQAVDIVATRYSPNHPL